MCLVAHSSLFSVDRVVSLRSGLARRLVVGAGGSTLRAGVKCRRRLSPAPEISAKAGLHRDTRTTGSRRHLTQRRRRGASPARPRAIYPRCRGRIAHSSDLAAIPVQTVKRAAGNGPIVSPLRQETPNGFCFENSPYPDGSYLSSRRAMLAMCAALPKPRSGGFSEG